MGPLYMTENQWVSLFYWDDFHPNKWSYNPTYKYSRGPSRELFPNILCPPQKSQPNWISVVTGGDWRSNSRTLTESFTFLFLEGPNHDSYRDVHGT